ncbi:hypothetical protein LIER_23755 [Lithospermum erythrorhizon]|uniref:Uncharacterized protein n=1 Tax=Lithospermum erythrorhizon TaxID=34254 RepID=A0AAV3R0Y9_LITER
MSTFNLAKKLKPARKAWNSFTIQVKYKFKNFSISKTIKNTKKHFISALHRIYSLIPHKIFDLLRSRRRCRYHLYHHRHCQQPRMKSFETVFVDQLFPNKSFDDEQINKVVKKTSSVASSSFSISLPEADDDKQVCSTTAKYVPKGVEILENKRGETSKSIDDNVHGLKLSLLSKFRGIDERAEDFIFKFKQDMKLESEKSILDYQEMLARGI